MARIEDSIAEGVLENYSTETPADAAPKAPRAVLNVPGAAVGRRKEAIARVRIVPGNGNASVNGRDLAEYFPNKLHQQLINDPFKVLDLIRSHLRRRPLGPGRRAAPGDRPCAERDRPREQPSGPQESRLPRP